MLLLFLTPQWEVDAIAAKFCLTGYGLQQINHLFALFRCFSATLCAFGATTRFFGSCFKLTIKPNSRTCFLCITSTTTAEVLSLFKPASGQIIKFKKTETNSAFKFWCRRRESNSHSFRHYHLKIACLPIPPRRPLSGAMH